MNKFKVDLVHYCVCCCTVQTCTVHTHTHVQKIRWNRKWQRKFSSDGLGNNGCWFVELVARLLYSHSAPYSTLRGPLLPYVRRCLITTAAAAAVYAHDCCCALALKRHTVHIGVCTKITADYGWFLHFNFLVENFLNQVNN